MNFKIGDIVQLKSGSIKMTIESISEESINCVWMTGGDLKRDVFNRDSIDYYVQQPTPIVRSKRP